MRDPGHSPQKIVSKFSVRICYNNIFQSSYSSYGTMCSFERWTDLSIGQWPNITYINKCVQSRRGQIYGQGNGPVLSIQSRRVFLSTGQWPNDICVYNVTTSRRTISGPLLWYLGKWGKWVFCEIFRTHTLRLVSPWGCPGNPAYPTAKRGYPCCPIHCIPFRRPPYSLERLPCSPGTSGGRPTARRLPYSLPSIPSIPSVP